MGKNLTRTLALSVTSFPILCLVLIFHSPVPHVHSPVPVACFEDHPSHGTIMIKICLSVLIIMNRSPGNAAAYKWKRAYHLKY